MLAKKYTLLLVTIFCSLPSAFAYLDPGSGSYILQMIIAGVLGGFYALKLYWNKIINFIKGNSNDSDSEEDLNHE